MPRFYCPVPLASGDSIALPDTAARHVQVLRLQPGAAITLFNGEGGEWQAAVTRMGRSDVEVIVGAHDDVERESAAEVHLACGMPANERMDWLVEKAVELGAASIQPLMTERTVLRLSGERAQKKQAHWQAIAVAACEQCGRNRVPVVHPVLNYSAWLAALKSDAAKFVLSLAEGTAPVASIVQSASPLLALTGPEGGLSAAEESAAIERGFAPVTLGARVLRAETAALAVLAAHTLAA